MKAKKLYTTIVFTIIFVRFILLSAQPIDEISYGISTKITRGDKLEFKNLKDTINKNFNYFVNVEYNEEELKNKYHVPDIHIFLNYLEEISICSHEKVIESFRQAFTSEKLNEISENSFSTIRVRNPNTGLYDSEKKESGETIQVEMLVDDSGNILMVAFSLNYNTLITPLELEKLETAILKNVRVEVPELEQEYNKYGPYSWSFTIAATAKEIINGEIETLKRGCIQAEKRRKQREYGKMLEQQQQQQ